MIADHEQPPVVVLESFGPPTGRNNPYFLLLVDAMPPGVDLRYFSWRAALTGRFDVFHLHWPEVVMHGRTGPRSLVRSLLFVVLLLRIRIGRKGLVRTLHNLAPHDPVPWWKQQILALADRWTTVWITLSERIPTPAERPRMVAPHGHFRDWFSQMASAETEAEAGRLLFFGRVRRYKGLPQLLRAFAALEDPGLSLHVVGQSDGDDLAADLRAASAADPRLHVTDDFVTDERLAEEIARAEVVVLPFLEMTNSSTLLLALSLDRPVLVPRLPVTEELAAEVGPGWVLTYDGDLDRSGLRAGLDALRMTERSPQPDLSGRMWGPIARQHEHAFRRAARSLR